jgi:hypothetical protein
LRQELGAEHPVEAPVAQKGAEVPEPPADAARHGPDSTA